jgi:hypothetical protein
MEQDSRIDTKRLGTLKVVGAIDGQLVIRSQG